MMTVDNIDRKKYSLIITIVRKGLGSDVIDISKNSGAEGGTIILGNGIAEECVYQNILGMDYNPEKEIILTLVQQKAADNVINAISNGANLNKPGNGIAFVIDVKNHLGIAHLLEKWTDKKGGF
ncbi:P-II family nitrogen regulator [Proteiniborus sp. MB09-C3]|uniref:P-II family nitrogen regulator n=1 Tax=Proteiniborus sp. MB09-C3 TaxID=3050072 RepID=UPI002557624F|nr:P-II family nitrogen regulator [Proteiniborus sp. MB09-C3]WIV12661.1 P-II family nitrogen regulator [Proteiniborus sp. MB09-C3]